MLEQIRSRVNGLRLDDSGSLAASVARRRVAVVDYPSTSFLEALVSGTPTLLFWDPEIWEMRAAAEPYLSLLRQAGILLDSPEAAARQLEAIYPDSPSWWYRPDIRAARDEFTRRFAFADRNWVRAWGKALTLETAAGRPARVAVRG